MSNEFYEDFRGLLRLKNAPKYDPQQDRWNGEYFEPLDGDTTLVEEHEFQHVGSLARKALARQRGYRNGEDPQAERAILMRLHGLTREEALQRYPLKEYDNWRRQPFAFNANKKV